MRETSHCKACGWTGELGPVAVCPKCSGRYLHTVTLSSSGHWQLPTNVDEPCDQCGEYELARESNELECHNCGAFTVVESDPPDEDPSRDYYCGGLGLTNLRRSWGHPV